MLSHQPRLDRYDEGCLRLRSTVASLHCLLQLFGIRLDFTDVLSAKPTIGNEIVLVLHDVIVKSNHGSIEVNVVDRNSATLLEFPQTELVPALIEVIPAHLGLEQFQTETVWHLGVDDDRAKGKQ